jgi:protoporphyrinogen oxidase
VSKPSTSAAQSIAVVGGGFTGLVAALRLAGKGYTVELFERGDTLGGLASGFHLHGTSIERAYHHLFRTDRDIIDLVNELGIGPSLHWHDSSVAIYWGGNVWPFMTPLDLFHFSPLPLLSRIRLGIVALYLQRQHHWRHFSRNTALQWMRSRAGDEATRIVWEPLMRGKFSGFADEVSMAWLWARVHTRGSSRAPEDHVERLGYFNGGFDVVVQSLRKMLEVAGVRLHTGAAVERITGGEPATVSVRGEAREFAAVVTTLPSHVFAKLLASDAHITESYLHQLESVRYLGAVCMVFSTYQELGKYYWVNVNEPGAPFVVFINHSRLVGSSRYDGHRIYYVGGYFPHDHPTFVEADAITREKWFAYVAKIYPEFERSSVVECHLTRFRNAQHVVDRGYERRIPGYVTPAPNVYLANFSQIFPEDRGTNFAVREGNRIAAVVAEALSNRSCSVGATKPE